MIEQNPLAAPVPEVLQKAGNRWPKGRSPNPGGRPRGMKEVRAAAAEHTGAAIKTLANILNNHRLPAMTRIAAANALLDRAVGRPVTPSAFVDENGEALPMFTDTPLQAVDLARRIAFLLSAGLRAQGELPAPARQITNGETHD